MTGNITFKEDELLFPEKAIKFDKKIRQIEFIDNLVIVLLDIPFDDESINNLYAFDISGVPVWRVEPLRAKFPDMQNLLPYEDIRIIDNKLAANDFAGRRFLINPADGSLIDFQIVK